MKVRNHLGDLIFDFLLFGPESIPLLHECVDTDQLFLKKIVLKLYPLRDLHDLFALGLDVEDLGVLLLLSNIDLLHLPIQFLLYLVEVIVHLIPETVTVLLEIVEIGRHD